MAKPVQVHGRGSDVVAAPELQPIALRSMFWRPAFLEASDAMEHVPLAFWLVESHRPKLVVELGVGAGTTYFAFCQAIERLGLDARCFGVDAWQQDAQAGESEDFERASVYNQARYSSFSRLLRGSFDASRRHFSPGSIDLLHIDGGHALESVTGDFESWAPKLSDRAVVLLHASNMRESGYGVHLLFERLKARFPSFEFVHGQGMGVLGVGPEQTGMLRQLFASADNDEAQWSIRDVFARLGRACLDAYQSEHETGRALALVTRVDADARRLAQLDTILEQARRELEARSAELDRTREKLDQQVERHAMERGQLSERVTLMLEMQAELKAQLVQARLQADQADQRARESTRAPEVLLASIQERLEATMEAARRHAQESDARSAIDAAATHEQALASARQVHEEELSARERAHAEALAASGRAHVEALAARDGAHAEALAAAERAHEEGLAAGERAHAEALAASGRAHAEVLAARDGAHAKALAAAERAHEEGLAAGERAHAEALAASGRAHAEVLAARDGAHAEALAAAERAHEEGLAAGDRAHAEALALLVERHAAELAAQERGQVETLEELRKQAADLAAEAQEARSAANAALAVAEQAQRAERSGAERHAATVAKLQADLAAASARATQVLAASRAEADAAAAERAKAATSVQTRFRETAQLTRRLLALQEQLEVEIAARAQLASELEAASAAHTQLTRELETESAARAQLAGELEVAQRYQRMARTERMGLQTQLEIARRAQAQSNASRDALRASRSWRVTRPLRALRGGELGTASGPLDAAELLRASPLFDPDWYLQAYPDVAEAGADPVLHYLEHGAPEGRDPGPDFSVGDYLRANPDIAEAGANPLVHYLEFGLAEGRRLTTEA